MVFKNDRQRKAVMTALKSRPAKVSDWNRKDVSADIKHVIDRYSRMTRDTPDPEHVSGGGLTITKDGYFIDTLYYKGTTVEKEALKVMRPELKKRGLKVEVGDLWYPA